MQSLNRTKLKVHKLIDIISDWLQSLGECDGDAFRDAMADRNIDPAHALAAVNFLAAVGVEGTTDRLHVWSIGGGA